MKSRNIKPGFFKNEELAEMPLAARLLFIGLWCMADREGRLENRPKRIRAEIFPYDDINIQKMIDVITCNGFIVTYNINAIQYIQINNFKKHQRPHPHEPKSIIEPCNYMSLDVGRNVDVMNVDVMNVDIKNVAVKPKAVELQVFDFESLWLKYPKRLGKKAAEKHFRSSVKTDLDLQNIQKALAHFLKAMSGKESQYIQNGSTWFNNWRDWIEYREEKNNASNGRASSSHESSFSRRLRENQGLRKADFQGSTESILAGIRDRQMHEEQTGEPIRNGDIPA